MCGLDGSGHGWVWFWSGREEREDTGIILCRNHADILYSSATYVILYCVLYCMC